MSLILTFILGAVFGAVTVLLISHLLKRKAGTEALHFKEEMEKVFKAASYDLSKQSIEEILKVSKEILESKTSEGTADLESKKKLIDQSLGNLAKDMQERMEKVQGLMTEINKTVPEKYGQVSSAIEQIGKQSENLRKTTESLNRALSSTQVRGQWGERMAEDILRTVGLQENINYVKQKPVEGGKSRPDFTFLLPNNLKLNMDVKFPYEKYREFLDADSDSDKERAKKLFLASVKDRIKEVTNRDYINPEENTVDYVLVFIPNERIYTFIQESDSSILDEALRQKVILCSPLTLYAMLALIRQAIDNFNLKQSSREIQALMGGFSKQWERFIDSMKIVGGRIDSARSAFDEMVGTRKRMLDRQVKKIDDLNKAEGIKPKVLSEDETGEIEDKSDPDKDNLLL
ncbi:MAG: DNA recombination protein RmuC [candidate division Zixibacteria bacterium]